MCSPAFFAIGNLSGENGINPLRVQVGPLTQPLHLHEGRRRDHGNRIAAPLVAGLIEQWNIEDNETRSSPPLKGEKLLPRLTNQRVQDRLQPMQGITIFEDTGAECRSIDAAGHDHARKQPVDRRYCGATPVEQPMHGAIGVVHRHPQPTKHRCRGALAHGNRTGKPQNDHDDAKPSRTNARNAAVTSGSMPNQAAKLARA